MRLFALPSTGRSAAVSYLALTLLLFVYTGAATAQDDQLGLFFDEAYTMHEYQMTAAPELVPAYLVLKNPSASGGVAGWECKLRVEGSAALVNVDYYGEVVNILEPPQFMVGVSNPPLPGGDTVPLARFDFMVTDTEPVVLRLLPTDIPSLPGQMTYLNADGLTELLPMWNDTGWDIAAWINVSSNPACATSQENLYFATVPVGGSQTLSLTVYNPGIVPLEITPAMLGGCTSFSVESEGETLVIPALGHLSLDVTFHPDAVGELECVLALNEVCPVVNLWGTGREPVITWEMPTEIDFGEILVGELATRYLTITNTGEVVFGATPTLTEGCDYFSLLATGYYPVPVGGSNTISIRFAPTEVGQFECILDMGEILPPVTLRGAARLPATTWEAPELVDFGDVDYGTTRTLPVDITNTGEVGIYLDFSLETGCEVFTLSAPAPLTLQPGASITASVTFAPQDLGEVTCLLDLGPVVPPVTLTGSSTREIVACAVEPEILEMVLTPLGVARDGVVTITNTGNVAVGIDPELAGDLQAFTIFAGGDPLTLEKGASHEVTVRFEPPAVATYEALLTFGEGLPEVPVIGRGLEGEDVCRVTPLLIDFGRVPVLSTRTALITVSNLGVTPLLLTPTTGLDELIVPAGPIEVPGGTDVSIEVEFRPETIGDFEGMVNLGVDACGTVTCIAEAVDPLTPGSDTVGLFFDSEYTVNDWAGGIPGVIQLYLALLGCSSPNGVGAWECSVGPVGGSAFFVTAYLEGSAINFGTGPGDFIVGVGTPLLPNEHGTLLATLLWISTDGSDIDFTLGPASIPSIPGEMVWLVGGTDELRPMFSVTGQAVVATWSGWDSVEVGAPPPAAASQGRQVTISWNRPDQQYDACRVMRRAQDEVPVPVSALLPNTGSAFTFTDDLSAFAPGQKLYYSYGLYVEDKEVARSSEVEVTVPAAVQYATGLLPNVPNPFNPQTEIRFELEKTGHARIVIFDVQGRKVRTLVDENLSSGPQSRFWYGQDDAGRQAPSGAYYVRLETDGSIDTQKILLLK